ncbi:hypothetical protein EG865_15620, partial [Enterococcus faecalis]
VELAHVLLDGAGVAEEVAQGPGARRVLALDAPHELGGQARVDGVAAQRQHLHGRRLQRARAGLGQARLVLGGAGAAARAPKVLPGLVPGDLGGRQPLPQRVRLLAQRL